MSSSVGASAAGRRDAGAICKSKASLAPESLPLRVPCCSLQFSHPLAFRVRSYAVPCVPPSLRVVHPSTSPNFLLLPTPMPLSPPDDSHAGRWVLQP